MATSTPPRHDDPAPAAPAPEPREQLLDTISAQAAAIDELIGLAKHSIRVFDYDLSETGWSSAARAERLASFLRTHPRGRIEIIVPR